MARISRERMIEVIRESPEDACVDDAIERLVFLAKIEEGLAQLDRAEGIPHEEVKRRRGLRSISFGLDPAHPFCDCNPIQPQRVVASSCPRSGDAHLIAP